MFFSSRESINATPSIVVPVKIQNKDAVSLTINTTLITHNHSNSPCNSNFEVN